MGTFVELLARLDSDGLRRGREFERICQWFLTNSPTYAHRLGRVWLWDEWPGRWGADSGIDLVAEDRDGVLWAIQAKAYDAAYSVTKADVDTFLSESARHQFAFRLLIATTNRVGRTARRTVASQEKPASLLLLADLKAAGCQWPDHPSHLRAKVARAARPRPYQRQAISHVVQGVRTAGRGQLIMACGTGKTLTALFIAEELGARRTLVLVPSLSLLAQTLGQWTANASVPFDFLPVCSDETVADGDAVVATTSELGFPVTTEPEDIAAFLRRKGRQVVFATYQSSPTIANAYRLGRVPRLDLAVADEAHRCAGRVSSEFGTILLDEAIPCRRRLFMTATPRYFTGRILREARDAEFEVASMDDPQVFGPVLHRLTFVEAIERDLLCDYQVAVIGVDDAEYRDWAERGRFVTVDGTKTTDARTLAAQIGLAKAMRRYGLRRTISFHSRVARARSFASTLPGVIGWMPADERPTGLVWADSVSGDMPTGDRTVRLERLRHLDKGTSGVLTNARCLSEGVDVPALDGVAFIDPRRSEVDIVQAVGRAIRKADTKQVGTIVIPVFIGGEDDADAALTDSTFQPVWDVVKALRAHDVELAEQLDLLRRELGRGARRVTLPEKIRLELPAHVSPAFAAAFNVRLVEQTTVTWAFWYGLLERYVEELGHARVPADYKTGPYPLGKWVSTQRGLHKTGGLLPERTRQLQETPGWSWDVAVDQWEAMYGELLDYLQVEGHLVPRSLRRTAKQMPKKLVVWMKHQRSDYAAGELSAARITKLEAVAGWSWEVKTDRWMQGYAHLVQFQHRVGHCRVPFTWVEDDFPLGHWVAHQRATFADGKLGPERRARLEAVPGWSWDTKAELYDAAWERHCQLVEAFAADNVHARVPTFYEVDGVKVGRWVVNQRTKYSNGTLSSPQVARLSAIPGWVWNVNDYQWNRGFEALRRFHEREGHLEVPKPWIETLPDGEEVKLGYWIGTQRQDRKKGTLADNRLRALESVAGWSWNTINDAWDGAMRRVETFVARHGHARIPVAYVDPDGFKLGQWAGTQRRAYRGNGRAKISARQVERLETLPGWRW